jgi:hypothetical protein
MTIRERLAERVSFRTQLQEHGKLLLPLEITDRLTFEPSDRLLLMWQAIWNNYLRNHSSTPTPYWYDEVNSPAEFNQFTKACCDAGWIKSIVVPTRHWAELELVESKLHEYIEPAMILHMRGHKKFVKYVMTETKAESNIFGDTPSETITKASRTRVNGKVSDTGITRTGFAKAGKSKFKFDTAKLVEYYDAIIANTTKGIAKAVAKHNIKLDGADYQSISTDIVDYYIHSDGVYQLGANINDSRGRAISSALTRVFNPIGFKDARALLLLEPKLITDRPEYLHAIYLFIAELNGIKRCESEQEKANLGKKFYINRELPELDLTDEEDLKDLHELIWLERLYDELDELKSLSKDAAWRTCVPLENDAGASLLQFDAVLLNHKPYMERTNLLVETGITDPWYIDGLTRPQVKFTCTPYLYGSSQTPEKLWSKNKVPFIKRDVALMSHHLRNGDYAVANLFKNFIIDNVQPTESMKIKIWNEEFTIECNRFKNVGDYTKIYKLYNSTTGTIERIAHTHTHKVPDLVQFRRYFKTLLTHNLDSQVANNVCKQLDWSLSIHDAFVTYATDAKLTRQLYAEQIEAVYADRQQILNDFFKSINLHPRAMKQWKQLQEQIIPLEGDFKCNDMALK